MKLNKYKTVSILIPVFNEEKTLKKLLKNVLALKLGKLKKEIIIVDDASTDGSKKLILELARSHKNVKIYSHEKNLGKGAAFRTALSHASGEIVVIQDADLEYPPKNILRIIDPILLKNANVVFGSRKLEKEKNYSSFLYYIGGAIIDIIIKTVLNVPVSDAICGPKAFNITVLKKIGKIESKGFEVDTELTAKIAKKRIRIVEVPITYKPRTHKQGKKIRWYDSFKIAWTLVKIKLS